MKTIYSLQEFRQEVLKLAAKKGQDYTHVRVEADNKGTLSFHAYINSMDWYKSDTMEGVLQILKDIIEPPIKATNSIMDIEIELETSDDLKDINI